MKRVVLIRSNPVNPDPPVEKMASTLINMGLKVLVLGWDRDDNYDYREETFKVINGECQIIRFGIKATFGAGFRGNFGPLVSFQKVIKKWLSYNNSKYDIIHAFDFDTGLVAKRIAKRYHKRLIYHILDYYVDAHNVGNSIIRSFIRAEENKIIAYADATIICTEQRKEQIKGSMPRNLYIIHNTPDIRVTNIQDLCQSTAQDSIKVVYVGILAGSRMLVELANVISKDPRFEFHVGGFGKLENQMKEKAAQYSNIFYYGKMKYEDVLCLERQCDVMVAIYDPKIRNNQFSAPNKMYEALMIGKPIIMAKNTGFDKLIADNEIGVLVDYSEEGIRDGLEKIRTLINKKQRISKRCIELYNDEYSWAIMETRIKYMYENL